MGLDTGGFGQGMPVGQGQGGGMSWMQGANTSGDMGAFRK
jgi:hypothetical protein